MSGVETAKVCNAGKRKDLFKKVVYIPGGTAPLFSTVLMLAVPATIAGCKIVLCSPPDKKEILTRLYAAQLCGVTKILKVGGFKPSLV
jgi:histidinol dehydrogenase